MFKEFVEFIRWLFNRCESCGARLRNYSGYGWECENCGRKYK